MQWRRENVRREGYKKGKKIKPKIPPLEFAWNIEGADKKNAEKKIN